MKHLQLILCFCLPLTLLSQPDNDECAGAIPLSELQNWCSTAGAYNNGNATESSEAAPDCFSEVGPDIWFTFTATATSINIRVLGDIVDIYGITAFSQGTMTQPRLALYQGTCEDLTLVGCDQDRGDNISELYSDEIVPSATYYLRISSPQGSSGTFQLCISSYNFVPNPNSDCPTGVVLCDKSSFFVASIEGAGSNSNEVQTSCLTQEDNSAWYKWVAGSSGTLSFTIFPNNPGDDIDFAVFELPNGLDDCDGMSEIRCMASGANGTGFGFPFIPAPFNEWDECTGPTGLATPESDVVEFAGCVTNTDNNFISAFTMEEGKAYALVILNFSATGHGFSIEFGGTGEFLGPEADFLTDDLDGTVCFGDPVTFFDRSSFGNLSIEDWSWNFGDGAVPQQTTGAGPHLINYSSGGIKSIALTVESETGCLVTTIGSVIIEDPFDIQTDIVHQSCPESMDASISLDITSGSEITSIQWDNGQTGTFLENLTPGDYAAVITNFNGCDTLVQYTIEAPMPLEIEEIITRPSCGGGADGSITINVSGQAPPFLFNFNQGGGWQSGNSLNGLAAAIYQVQIQDDNGCLTELTVPLGEIEIELDPDFDPVTPPTCFGFNDGRVEIRIVGGTPSDYAYDWGADGGYVPENFLDRVRAGTLPVAIRDNANCLGFAIIDVMQPDELIVNVDTTDISCFGEVDGALTPNVFGGAGNYEYSWSNMTGDSIARDLNSGQYQLSVTDANGCLATAAGFISEPPILNVVIDSTRDVVCFGEPSGAIYFTGNGGNPPFTYSIDGVNFSDSLFFENLTGGSYSLTIRDERGCTQIVPTEIFQPAQLVVNAGQDTAIDLGFSATLLATHQPLGKPVNYQWTPGESLSCVDCPTPIAGPLQSTTYTVTIVDDNNCTAVDQVEVLVFLNRPVFIPNTFTPNNDGFNDRLTVYGGAAARGVRKIQIFDRWGEMVYEGRNLTLNDETVGWDGTHQGSLMNPGVFVYVAEIEFIDNSVLAFEGDITLLR
ncbi:MAG: T9SS type B sorting domain-containing protein [Saprospiraceae bacterium]|nr:T9SS type B sorting domain-containing protein [Saprospiraceae bacterium]